MALVRLPHALNVIMPDGSKCHIPEGAQVEVDASTNLVLYGGFAPEDVSEYTFGEGENTAKRFKARIANKRPWKNFLGEPRTSESTQYLKFQGQVVATAEKIRKGNVLAMIGHFGVDRKKNSEEEKKKSGKEFSYYPHFLVSDLAVLRGGKSEGGEESETTEKAAPASQAVGV